MTNEKCLAFGETTGSEEDEKKAIMAGAIKIFFKFFLRLISSRVLKKAHAKVIKRFEKRRE